MTGWQDRQADTLNDIGRCLTVNGTREALAREAFLQAVWAENAILDVEQSENHNRSTVIRLAGYRDGCLRIVSFATGRRADEWLSDVRVIADMKHAELVR
jgi:hypothetical protein